jgi:membrane peptidoglycan carboxypeptidase
MAASARVVPGSTRPVRDDALDATPHGNIGLDEAIRHSCNAYFAQLGQQLGADPLIDMASRFHIDVARPNTPQRLRPQLPYARVRAGRGAGQPDASVDRSRLQSRAAVSWWNRDGFSTRARHPRLRITVLPRAAAERLARDMAMAGEQRNRTQPCGRDAGRIAGKTGTREVTGGRSHAWFTGFAPYGEHDGPTIAFVVLVRKRRIRRSGRAPDRGELVAAVRELELFLVRDIRNLESDIGIPGLSAFQSDLDKPGSMKNILEKALHHAGQLDAVVDGFVNRKLRGDRALTPAEILTGVTREIDAAVTARTRRAGVPVQPRACSRWPQIRPSGVPSCRRPLPPDDVRERLVQHLQRRAQVPADLRVDVRLASQIENPAGFDVALRHVAARVPAEHSGHATPRRGSSPPTVRCASRSAKARFTSVAWPTCTTAPVGSSAGIRSRSRANADSRTVSRAHARIQGVRDQDALAFMLFDEGSRYGSSVVRDGRAHKVLHGSVGFKLKDGDEVYFGRVHLQFRVAA